MLPPIAASLGFGSGIDTAQLVTDLAAASRGPKAARFDTLARETRARISAVGQARSDLESFASSLAALVAGGTLRSSPSVSDASVLTATTLPSARIGALASEIEVTALARAQTVSSAVVSAAADPVGQGSLTLSVGGQDYSVVIDSSNDSLTGLAQAINAANSGVRASIITEATGARLVLKGQTGAAAAFTLTAAPGSQAGLDNFTYGGSGGLTLGQSARDAAFTVDGVAYARATNTVTDVIAGVSLTLRKADPGTIVAIGTARPDAAIAQTVGDFVSVFNSLKQSLASARTATGGDPSLRALDAQIGALIGRAVTSDAAINSLSDIGVATNRDGSISLDTERLNAAIAADPEAVEALFSPLRDATHTEATDPGLGGALSAIAAAVTSPTGSLASLTARLQGQAATIENDRARMEAREDVYAARLQRQFGSMDARIGALRSTQTFLEQQIRLWTNER